MRFIIVFVLVTQLGFSQKRVELPSWVTNTNIKHPDFNSDEFESGSVVSVKYNSKKELEEAKKQAVMDAESTISKKYSVISRNDISKRIFNESEKNINGKINFNSKEDYFNQAIVKRLGVDLIGLVTKLFVDTKKRTVYAVAAFNVYQTRLLHKDKIDQLNKNISENLTIAENAVLRYIRSEDVTYKIEAISAYNTSIKSIKEMEKNSTLYNVLNLEHHPSMSIVKVEGLRASLLKSTLNLNDFAFTISETLKGSLGKKDGIKLYPAILKNYGETTEFSKYINRLLEKHLIGNNNSWQVIGKFSNNKTKYTLKGSYDLLAKDSIINYTIDLIDNKDSKSLFKHVFELSNRIVRREGLTYRDKDTENLINKQKQIENNTLDYTGYAVEINIYEDGKLLSQENEVVFKEGKEYRFTLKSNKGGYIRLIYEEIDKDLALLIDSEPFNKTDGKYIPIPNTITVGPPYGLEKLHFQFSEQSFPYAKPVKWIGSIPFIKTKKIERAINITRGMNSNEKKISSNFIHTIDVRTKS
ncbi:hypothetical protein [Polaribacter sp. R77954]|uniref:hypothetical protein n=1 Tax=Polaribacter sp. R77954 TaxID=3093870 RepID=UPI0037C70B60